MPHHFAAPIAVLQEEIDYLNRWLDSPEDFDSVPAVVYSLNAMVLAVKILENS